MRAWWIPFLAGLAAGVALAWGAGEWQRERRGSEAFAPGDAPDRETPELPPRSPGPDGNATVHLLGRGPATEPTANPNPNPNPNPSADVDGENVLANGGSVRIRWTSDLPPLADSAHEYPPPSGQRLLDECWKRAEGRSGTAGPDAGAVREWLASADAETVMAGIGCALRVDPPLVDALVALAHDPDYGPLRVAAMRALLSFHRTDPVVFDLVVRLAADEAPFVQHSAIEALSTLGERGADAALSLIAPGLSDTTLHSLARAIATSSDLLGRLAAIRDTRLLAHVSTHVDPDALDPGTLDALRRVLPSLIRQHAEDPAIAHALPLLAAVGLPPALEAVVTSAHVPLSVRQWALEAALEAQPDETGVAALLARVLGDARSPGVLVELALDRLADESVVAEPDAQSALWRLLDESPDPWIRATAHERLQLTEPADGALLSIRSAVYGKDDVWVDVRSELSRRVVRGRLTVEASNDLAGDPLFGTVKELVVEYEYAGRSYRRTVPEGAVLRLP